MRHPARHNTIIPACIAATCVFTIVCATSVSGRRITDKRPLPNMSQAVAEDTISADTSMLPIIVEIDEGEELSRVISFAGFDKALSGNTESVFVTNDTDMMLVSVTFTVTYTNMQGEMLHRRQLTQQVDIAPHERRRVDFPTWDKQKQFYYHRTAPRPRRTATPFEVSVRPDKAIFSTQ